MTCTLKGTIMDWEQISKDEIENILSQEFDDLPSDLQNIFNASKIDPIRKLKCIRPGADIVEEVFEILRIKNTIIIYDDVEEEFGVTVVPSDTDPYLKYWNLFIDLGSALKHVVEIN